MVPETSERRSRQAEQMAAPANETAVRGPSGEPMIGSDEREIRCRDSGAAAIAMAPRPWRGRQCVAAGLMGADSHASLTGESRHSVLLELPRVDAVLLHLEVQRNTQPLVNALKHEKKLAVLAALVEGNSIRAAGKSSRTIRRAPAPDELLKPIYVNVRSNSEKLTSNCQELWIEGDQAAAFFPRFFCGSHCTPSSNRTPARTSGTSSAASTLRQCPSATCSSLNAIINPAVREPAPFVTPSRKRTVANVDSMGFVVRRCFQCSAG